MFEVQETSDTLGSWRRDIEHDDGFTQFRFSVWWILNKIWQKIHGRFVLHRRILNLVCHLEGLGGLGLWRAFLACAPIRASTLELQVGAMHCLDTFLQQPDHFWPIDPFLDPARKLLLCNIYWQLSQTGFNWVVMLPNWWRLSCKCTLSGAERNTMT